jgi:Methyltransferase FkbM domain
LPTKLLRKRRQLLAAASLSPRPLSVLLFRTLFRRLWDIIPSSLIDRVHLLKLDIEGGEIPVMENLISHIDRFNPGLQVIAEVSVSELKEEWRAIIARMHANGFSTYSITNDYDDDCYLNWHIPDVPVPLRDLPETQFDVLFRREN